MQNQETNQKSSLSVQYKNLPYRFKPNFHWLLIQNCHVLPTKILNIQKQQIDGLKKTK